MNIIVKPSCNNLDSYIEKKVKYFLLPIKEFSVESINTFSIGEIKNIRESYPDISLFVSINKNIINDDIENLKKVLLELDKLQIKGVFYYDICLVKLKSDMNLSFDLVWDQSHMVTNYKTCDYYYNNGVKYALLSKEITLEEILEIIKNTSITPIVEVLSHPSVAFSKRHLVRNYYKNLQKEIKDEIVIKEKVSGDSYYVVDDDNGTNFLKKDIVQGCSFLDQLIDGGLDYSLLREDFIEHDVFLKAIDIINCYLDGSRELSLSQKFVSDIEKLLGKDYGFFFKKTIYRVKK